MKRIAALITAGGMILTANYVHHPGGPNGSTDGRYHTCGYTTEEGVTEHLTEYQVRCNPYAIDNCWVEDNPSQPAGHEVLCVDAKVK